jgi:hypothetical protein
MLVALALIFLLVPLTATAWIKRQPQYRLTWDHGRFRACPDFKLWPFVGRPIDINNRPAATIKKTFAGIQIRAKRDHTVDQAVQKTLNPGGTDFNVARRDDGPGINFSFLKAGRFRATARRSNNKDIFGEISYGSGTTAETGRNEVGSLPIRKPITTSFEKGGMGKKNADDDLDLDSLLG